ncbi:hypothetical protein COO03_04600 [Bacillus sp. AFS098217]|uniref:hypothetical protein n=1 Tax=Bacillus sp. AFS098217 TaxID=2033868 RepID=UPI000BEDFC5F|nr:hypothetical protein [Bacillus sp. AFS098217]PEB54529.1 hypothetical protein COO03_04600 [Bacillus sp. AFS098217]
MRKLFMRTNFTVGDYILMLKLNKMHALINIERTKLRLEEEMYILNAFQHNKVIDFSKISSRSINHIQECMGYFDVDEGWNWEDIDNSDIIAILLLSMNIYKVNLANFYPCQTHFLHHFKRMHDLGIDVTIFHTCYLERVNVYELDCEEGFKDLANTALAEMGLEVTEVDNEDINDLLMFSAIFDIPIEEIKEITQNFDEPIGEMIKGITLEESIRVSKALNDYPVEHKYNEAEKILYIYYGEEYLFAVYRLEMILDILELMHNQGETTNEDNSNI